MDGGHSAQILRTMLIGGTQMGKFLKEGGLVFLTSQTRLIIKGTADANLLDTRSEGDVQ